MRPSTFRLLTGLCAAVLCLGLALAAQACAEPASGPVVSTDSGKVQGRGGQGIVIFKGVPYAAAPVGPLRWRSPQPVKPWDEVRDAGDYGASCLQAGTPRNVDPSSRGANTSEDCLYLNVWAPASPKGRAPVIVWIHGGGDTDGTASQTYYDGSSFARDGVVLVSMNYRLGPLGFFAHPALAAEQAKEGANYGLMDQIAALKWVRRNAAAFGGDPDRITVMGESAGGVDIIALIGSPQAKGLFRGAIVQSAGMGWDVAPKLAEVRNQGVSLTRDLAPANATPENLRAIPGEALVKAGQGRDVEPFVDGVVLPDAPLIAWARQGSGGVSLLIGSNSGEGSLLYAEARPEGVVAGLTPDDLKTLRGLYGDKAATDPDFARLLFRDSFFAGPARWMTMHSRSHAWLYRFDYVRDSLRSRRPSASHGSEIPFEFRTWRGMRTSDADLRVEELVHRCWVSFARDGAPACVGAEAKEGRRLTIDDPAQLGPIPEAAMLDLLERRTPAMIEANKALH
ncbi:MAG: carboxylesterase/lipase family protein [Proteobacteria bacterium]|nr:carboxylesterase/lipase family protein [Pseudomonadota bacterium]